MTQPGDTSSTVPEDQPRGTQPGTDDAPVRPLAFYADLIDTVYAEAMAEATTEQERNLAAAVLHL